MVYIPVSKLEMQSLQDLKLSWSFIFVYAQLYIGLFIPSTMRYLVVYISVARYLDIVAIVKRDGTIAPTVTILCIIFSYLRNIFISAILSQWSRASTDVSEHVLSYARNARSIKDRVSLSLSKPHRRNHINFLYVNECACVCASARTGIIRGGIST